MTLQICCMSGDAGTGKGGPSAAADGPPSPRTVRKQRRKGLRLEGSPWLGVFGYVEWLLLFLGLTAAYVLQWLEVTASPLAKLPWLATVKDILTETMW